MAIPNDGTDVWEIDPRHLKFGNKFASRSYRDLFKGTYCNQDMAIKVLKPVVKVADFGVARVKLKAQSGFMIAETRTNRCMAPEILKAVAAQKGPRSEQKNIPAYYLPSSQKNNYGPKQLRNQQNQNHETNTHNNQKPLTNRKQKDAYAYSSKLNTAKSDVISR
ncbi:hypothetical protein V6N13_004912 [Hibiscus sabdariffa]